MPKKKVVLTFPKNLVGKPMIYQLVKDYDLVINILRAQIMPDEEGKVVLELEGTKSNLDKGLQFLKARSVHMQLLGRDIRIEEKKCIDCGACTAVCLSKALYMDPGSRSRKFNRSRCVLCGLCVDACPLGLIRVTF